jgi:IclR family pca regulon transcriptional regulator
VTGEAKVERSNFVGSLANGLAILTSFDAEHPTLTISQAASLTGLTRASARRALLTLSDLGFLSQDGSAFSLTPRALSIGHSYLNASGLGDVVARRISELSAELRESVSAAVLDGHEIVYIARSAATKIMQVRISVGTRFPAAATSMGRVMLAGLADAELERVLSQHPVKQLTPRTKTSTDALLAEIRAVRTQGYAVVNQELELGLKSVAVPIRNRQGKIVAAINIAGPAASNSSAFEPQILKALQACAEKITEDLGSA